jgi:pyridoxal phosphate enzyme (YggS family)
MNLSNLKQGVEILAVTKTRTAEEILPVLAKYGITKIGENRWQEAATKLSAIPAGIEKHFIGHLQTNKAKEVVRAFDVIQSVDSERLARAIEKECAVLSKVMPVYMEVNTSGEAQKGGVALDQAEALADFIRSCPHLKLEGLMTVAMDSENKEDVRACFKKLRGLFETLNARGAHLKTLSMGMSQDYEIAIEEGSTMIRIGSALFGPRL